MVPIRSRHVPRCVARRGAGPLCALLSAAMALVLLGLLLVQPHEDEHRPGFLVARHQEAPAPRF